MTARFRAVGRSFPKGVVEGTFAVPDEKDGGIDFASPLQILKATNHDGWVLIEAEQNPSLRNPLLYQTLGLATLQRLSCDKGLI